MRCNSMTRREIFLIICWALYDLANQFFALNVVTMYFPRWLTLEKNAPEIFYSLSFGISMVLVGVCAPFLGTISDMQQKRRVYLINFTVLSVVFTLWLGFLDNVFLALVCFAIANFGCQIAVVFYNALLVHVARKERLGLVSGLGRVFAYTGAILALYFSKPVIAYLGYRATFLMTGVVFLIFALPALLFIREKKNEEAERLICFFTKEKLKAIFYRNKSAFFKGTQWEDIPQFLRVFFFGLCAVQTMMLFMAVYASRVFKLSEFELINLIIFSTVFAILGSIIAGLVNDRWGSRKAMTGVFALWALGLLGGAFLNPPFHWLIGAIIGLALSSTWVVARAWVVRLVPEENIGEVFGLFNFVGYIAGVVGPLFWGMMVFSLSFLGEWGYRLSLLSLLIFVGLAVFHLFKIPNTVKKIAP